MRRVMKTGRAEHLGLSSPNPIWDNTAAEPAVGRAGANPPAPLERAIHGRCPAPKLSAYSPLAAAAACLPACTAGVHRPVSSAGR